MSRRPLLVVTLGLLLVAGLLTAGIALLRPDAPAQRVAAPPAASLAPDARTPEDLARAACVQVRLAAQGIQAGRPAQEVRVQLAAGRSLAARALRGDGRWAALSGGVAALDEAVRRDEGAPAATGLRVALAECAALQDR